MDEHRRNLLRKIKRLRMKKLDLQIETLEQDLMWLKNEEEKQKVK